MVLEMNDIYNCVYLCVYCNYWYRLYYYSIASTTNYHHVRFLSLLLTALYLMCCYWHSVIPCVLLLQCKQNLCPQKY